MKCAVANCNEGNGRKSCDCSFFSFPHEPTLAKKWVKFCNRGKLFNPKTSYICMKHFATDDILNNLEYKMGFAKKRLLKRGVVPTIYNAVENTNRSKRLQRRENKAIVLKLLEEAEANKSSEGSDVIAAQRKDYKQIVEELLEEQQHKFIAEHTVQDINSSKSTITSANIELINEEIYDEGYLAENEGFNDVYKNNIMDKMLDDNIFLGKEELNNDPVVVNQSFLKADKNLNDIKEEVLEETIFSDEDEFINEPTNMPAAVKIEHLRNISKCGFVVVTTKPEKNYYLSCFYCSVVFPIYKWHEFCNHTNETHNEFEKEFATSDQETNNDKEMKSYVSLDNDEIISLVTSPSVNQLDTIDTDTDSMGSHTFGNEVIEKFDGEILNAESYQRLEKMNPNMEHNYNQPIEKQPEVNKENSVQIQCNDIRFGSTHRAIVFDFLKRLKSFPNLWYTNLDSIETYEADLETILNDMNCHWGLKLSKTVLRYNLERIKRYYNKVLLRRKEVGFQTKYEGYLSICDEIPNPNIEQKDNELLKATELTERLRRRFEEKKEKHLYCPVCDKGFVLEDKFKIHVQLHSSETRTFKCEICDQYYLTESMLRIHKKRHDAPKYVCNICSKSYTYKSNLEIHMKIHTGNLDIVCEWCGKGFPDKKSYLTHIKYKHNSEGRCNICNHSCQTAAALDKHLKRFHRPLVLKYEDLKRAKPRQTIKEKKGKGQKVQRTSIKRRRRLQSIYDYTVDPLTGKRQYCCPNCDKKYLAYDSLYAHIANKHGYEPIKASFPFIRKNSKCNTFKKKIEKKKNLKTDGKEIYIPTILGSNDVDKTTSLLVGNTGDADLSDIDDEFVLDVDSVNFNLEI